MHRAAWMLFAALVACARPMPTVADRREPAPAPGPDAAPPDGGPADAAPPDGGPVDAAPVACPEGYADRDPRAVMPGFELRDERRVCDLGDRIIVVDDRAVTVLARPALTRARAPIARTEHLGDRCGGPGGGHVGCSITFTRFWSPVLGASYLEVGTNMGNVLVDERDPDHLQECREASAYQVIATCSTATRFALVRYEEPAYGEACSHLRAHVWDGAAAAPVVLDGDVDRAASVGARWVFRFPATRAVALAFDRRARSATLEVGGERERCAVFRLSRP